MLHCWSTSGYKEPLAFQMLLSYNSLNHITSDEECWTLVLPEGNHFLHLCSSNYANRCCESGYLHAPSTSVLWNWWDIFKDMVMRTSEISLNWRFLWGHVFLSLSFSCSTTIPYYILLQARHLDISTAVFKDGLKGLFLASHFLIAIKAYFQRMRCQSFNASYIPKRDSKVCHFGLSRVL